MPYPDKLMFDYYAQVVSDLFEIDHIGQPFFEISDDSDDTTGYRFATKPTSGTCYIKFDRSEI